MKRISMRLQDGLLTGFSGKKVSPKMPTLRPGVQLSEALSIFEIPALRAVSEEDRQGIISKLTPIVFDAEAIAIQQGDSDAPKQIIFFIEGTAEVSLHCGFRSFRLSVSVCANCGQVLVWVEEKDRSIRKLDAPFYIGEGRVMTDNASSNATIKTLEKSRGFLLSKADCSYLLKKENQAMK